MKLRFVIKSIKKLHIIIITLFCFALALFAQRGIEYYAQQKAKQEFARYLKQNQPYFSPSETVKHFWQLASEGKEEVNLFRTKVPKSFWINCVE